uniref:Uncharacterized protein n=1 Tax=Tetranychus urticae TaxID=32264 RepID=T1L2N8_TETUR
MISSFVQKLDSDKDVASVTFTAKQVNGVNYVTINLVGYNIKESEYQQVFVSINSGSDSNKYICDRNTYGSTSAYFNGPQSQVISGSSKYQSHTLYCSWTMSREDSIWPKNSIGKGLDLESNSRYGVMLSNRDQTLMVAANIKDLPIYQMKFLNCCYKVHGNDKLTGSDSSQLDFGCYLEDTWMDSLLKMDDQSENSALGQCHCQSIQRLDIMIPETVFMI